MRSNWILSLKLLAHSLKESWRGGSCTTTLHHVCTLICGIGKTWCCFVVELELLKLQKTDFENFKILRFFEFNLTVRKQKEDSQLDNNKIEQGHNELSIASHRGPIKTGGFSH